MSGFLTILRPGMMMTVQDAGRFGLLHQGVSASGAMDPDAYRIANALVSNDAGSAVLEFAIMGGALSVSRDCRIAITGGACDIRIGDRVLPGWESHWLKAGEILTIGALRDATWGYVAVSGGIDTAPVLGSRSTHLRTALGGHQGRLLAADDALPLGREPERDCLCLGRPFRRAIGPIRVVAGPQDDYFSKEIWQRLLTESFSVGTMRDRMAAMLDGPSLPAIRGHDIVSDGTLAGSLQVPSSGRPIVLMADRQTTGGYPKIATIISADLGRFAQMPSGRAFRFRAVSAEQAEDVGLRAARELSDVIATLIPAETDVETAMEEMAS
ncbi:biotin-dependent carboxyltransferase family protein [Rhizobium sp. CG5]|uniref:5-oxoprolinase subunit C family protein n=1 Tax=Rhizobium sp. CG5 TaxID=2726076 RepID=UPI002033B48F|nr:biotin-dependent carboxyltransferase family protein [Rhizobium sp. CG5]MCM2477063.1 biotin-dependent carboxyltransferase family protein [Rhizobium sp. CG5]